MNNPRVHEEKKIAGLLAKEAEKLHQLGLEWNHIKASEKRLLLSLIPPAFAQQHPSGWMAADPPHTSDGGETQCRVKVIDIVKDGEELTYTGALQYVNATTGAIVLNDAQIDASHHGFEMSVNSISRQNVDSGNDDKTTVEKNSNNNTLFALNNPSDMLPLFSDKKINKHLAEIMEDYDALTWEPIKDLSRREMLHQILDKVEQQAVLKENRSRIVE